MRFVQHRAREIISSRIATAGDFFDLGSAGIRQAQHLSHLVIGLPRRVVAGAAQFLIATWTFHIQQQGVTAGNDQRCVRWNRGLVEKRRQQMAFQMVDAQEGSPRRAGHGFGRRAADQQRRRQPRTGGGGKCIDLRHGNACIRQRLFHQAAQVK